MNSRGSLSIPLTKIIDLVLIIMILLAFSVLDAWQNPRYFSTFLRPALYRVKKILRMSPSAFQRKLFCRMKRKKISLEGMFLAFLLILQKMNQKKGAP